MATMRRVEVNWVVLWMVGVLCGGLLMFGVDTMRQSSHDVAPPVGFVSSFNETAPAIGGRLGGIVSSDTANDWNTRQALRVNEAPIIGGRLGGIANSDTANDAAIKTVVSQVTGPGEGLNQFVDVSSYAIGSSRITEPGEGLHQFQDTTSFAATGQHIVGPGEGLNQVP